MQKIADRLQMDVVEAASGAVQIVEFHMADLMRQMTVQRGLDPRDFVVYAYGGGGPTHAVSYTRELGCRTVVVPLGSVASTWSALGIQSADLLHIYEKAELLIAPFDPGRINAIFFALEAQGRAQLQEDGIAETDMQFRRSADMKFRLQIHRVEVPVPTGILTAHDTECLMHAFADKYESLYGKGSAFKDAGTEIGVFRVAAVGTIRRPSLARQMHQTGEARVGQRGVYWRELQRFTATPIYNGTTLAARLTVTGPAVIEMPETTIVLRPQSTGQLDEYGNFVITIA
jgi:N-methylhydantoinase A